MHSCPHSLRDSDSFLLRNPSGHSNHKFTGWASRAEVFFFETHELNTVRCEPFDVFKGFGDALTRETVEGPNENQIDLAL